MKSYDKMMVGVIVVMLLIGIGVNCSLAAFDDAHGGRPWLVEVNRIALVIETDGPDAVDLSGCDYVTKIESYGGDDFYNTSSDYCIREIKGELYRFDYSAHIFPGLKQMMLVVNLALGVMGLFIVIVMLIIRHRVLSPFADLTNVPYELAKGNLTVPLKEHKSRLFGGFVWGVNLLRETMEEQKQRELQLQRDKKTLLLSLSHDIKTPLSAIKLYAKALEKGLYTQEEMQSTIAEAIDEKADEIEEFVSEIVQASREDFLSLEVDMGEYYLSEVISRIRNYYREKLVLLQTEFTVGAYVDCLLKADIDRSEEVLQNIMENAIKYGDGKQIEIGISEEADCILLTVKNSGCSLSEPELPHIFESFWRGSNVKNQSGSGLGLYICRQLMHKMGGEVFAELGEDFMTVTAVFVKV